MPLDWTNIFFNLAFNDAIADMDDAERQRTLARLREAIANCPDALGLPSFWAHMQSCSDDEWDRTMARNDQVGAHSPSALGSAQALLRATVPCCVAALEPSATFLTCAVVRASAQIGGFDSKALSTDSFWSHAGKAKPAEWRQTVARIGQVGAPPAHSASALGSAQAMRPRLAVCRRSRHAVWSRHVLCCVRWRRSAGSTPRR